MFVQVGYRLSRWSSARQSRFLHFVFGFRLIFILFLVLCFVLLQFAWACAVCWKERIAPSLLHELLCYFSVSCEKIKNKMVHITKWGRGACPDRSRRPMPANFYLSVLCLPFSAAALASDFKACAPAEYPIVIMRAKYHFYDCAAL